MNLNIRKNITKINFIDTEFVTSLRPLLSLTFLVLTLLGLVFLQMEERRLGYQVLKLERQQRNLVNQRRMKEVQLARMMKPQNVKKIAQQRLTLKKTESHQVIHMNSIEESTQ